jgi:putative spermidine/putrescine transport system permease protein
MTQGIGLRAPGALESVQGAATGRRRRRFGLVRLFWWLVFIVGAIYFFVPLIGTLAFSLRDVPPTAAYTGILDDQEFGSTLLYSFVVGVLTVIVSTALVVPTAFWVRLKLPRIRPLIEFITLLPFMIPPVVLVFGLISTYSQPPLPLMETTMGANALLVAAYVVLSLPYMYRAADAGLSSIDIRALTEAGQILGAGWPTILIRIILPNVRVAVLSGAFLTLAIVIGEFTIASFLGRPAFAPYLGLLGSADPFRQAAVALVSFGLTWIAMIIIAFLGRSSQTRISVAGAH